MNWADFSVVLTMILYMVAAVFFIRGIKLLGRAETARKGNCYSSLGMLIAIVSVFLEKKVTDTFAAPPAQNAYVWALVAIVIGSAIGAVWSKKVKMTGMPELVALFNGFGGLSSLLVALTQYLTDKNVNVFSAVTLGLTITIGAFAFTGSVVAWGKLSGKMFNKNLSFAGKNAFNGVPWRPQSRRSRHLRDRRRRQSRARYLCGRSPPRDDHLPGPRRHLGRPDRRRRYARHHLAPRRLQVSRRRSRSRARQLRPRRLRMSGRNLRASS